MSPSTHCYLSPLICRCLPIFDEICRRSINFARACLLHESALIRQIATYGIYIARNESFLGQNVLFCAERYRCTVGDLLFGSINNIIHSFANSSLDEKQLSNVTFLAELIDIRDNRRDFSRLNLSHDEVSDIISFVCTC